MSTATTTEKAADRTIGTAACPLHPHKAVPVKLSKNGLAYLVHAGCCQLFTRGDTADELLRGLLKPAAVKGGEAAPAAPVEVKPVRENPPKNDKQSAKEKESWLDW